MRSKWLACAAMVAGVIFAAKADGAKWTYEGTTLTQIVDEGVTPQVFKLDAKGNLSMTTAGTATEIDLRDAALPDGTPKITYMARMSGGKYGVSDILFSGACDEYRSVFVWELDGADECCVGGTDYI